MTTTPTSESDTTAAPAPPGRSDLAVVGELIPYLRPYLGRIVLSLGLILASKVATLLVPLVLKRLVDQLNLERSLLVLPVGLLLAYGASRVGVTLFTELRQVVFARVMARTSRQITVKVFRHLHELSLRFHLDRRTGGVARDLQPGRTAVSDLLDWTLYTIVPTAVEVLLVTVLLVLAYDWSFALIILTTLAAYAAWSFIVTEWRTRYYRAAVEADTRANERAVDSLINYETVKYFNNERHETARYDESLRRLEDANVLAQKSLALLNLGQTVIVAIGVTAMLWRAAAGAVGRRAPGRGPVRGKPHPLHRSSPP